MPCSGDNSGSGAISNYSTLPFSTFRANPKIVTRPTDNFAHCVWAIASILTTDLKASEWGLHQPEKNPLSVVLLHPNQALEFPFLHIQVAVYHPYDGFTYMYPWSLVVIITKSLAWQRGSGTTQKPLWGQFLLLDTTTLGNTIVMSKYLLNLLFNCFTICCIVHSHLDKIIILSLQKSLQKQYFALCGVFKPYMKTALHIFHYLPFGQISDGIIFLLILHCIFLLSLWCIPSNSSPKIIFITRAA